MSSRTFSLRSDAGKALLELTREQFKFWEDQLSKVAEQVAAEGGDIEFKSSNAMHYWHILSTLAVDGDAEFKVLKKTVEACLPRLSTETGRKHLSECEKLGLTRTITDRGTRYAALTEVGEGVLAHTLSRWITEFGQLQATHFSQTEEPESG